METTQPSDTVTFRRLRKTIGYLGISLPISLVVFSLVPFFKTDVQSSISHFYYTNLREIFTGTLCAVGLFLIRYKGYHHKDWYRNDNLLTNLSGGMAFGVALVPTSPEEFHTRIPTFIPYPAEWLGWLHYGFAGTLFISFAILSYFAFTLGQQKNENIPISRLNENNVYRACGVAIIAFIILIPIAGKMKLYEKSTLVFEALSLLCFGIAWLVKGRALGDKGTVGRKLYRETNR